VARLDEKVVSYRSFFVSRQSPPPAVAERDGPERDADKPGQGGAP